MNASPLCVMAAAALLCSASVQADSIVSIQKEHPMIQETLLLRPVNPAGAAIPGISSAMVVENGRLMFLSGHVPMAADGTVAVLAPDAPASFLVSIP